jgi:hypothetical protein
MTPTSAGEPAAGREVLHTARRGDHTEVTLARTRRASDIRIHPEQAPDRLFIARFTGRQPTVSVARGTVSIRYPVGLSCWSSLDDRRPRRPQTAASRRVPGPPGDRVRRRDMSNG